MVNKSEKTKKTVDKDKETLLGNIEMSGSNIRQLMGKITGELSVTPIMKDDEVSSLLPIADNLRDNTSARTGSESSEPADSAEFCVAVLMDQSKDTDQDEPQIDNALSDNTICSDCDKLVKSIELYTHNCINEDEQANPDCEASNKENISESEKCRNYIEESRRQYGIYSCHECPLVFTSSENYKSHIQSHPVNGVFCCGECQKVFKSYDALRTHERIHNGTAPHACSLCPKTFNQPVHLKAHMRRHQGVTPFKCTLCPKAYADKTSLNYHMSSHTGQRPFTCPHCPRGFSKKAAWQVHVNSHDRNKTTKKVSGNSCKSTSVPVTLTENNGNSGFPIFSCLHCTKTFQSRSGLRKHQRCHKGLESHFCPTCFQAFSSIPALRAHQRNQHATATPTATASSSKGRADVKQFICAKCSKIFSDVMSLTQHKVKVHST